MGFRYRRSIKIAPGVKVNVGKKSAGISIGNKYGGVSINSKTGVRARASAPGTGLSYSTKIGGSHKTKSTSPNSNAVQYARKDNTPIKITNDDFCEALEDGNTPSCMAKTSHQVLGWILIILGGLVLSFGILMLLASFTAGDIAFGLIFCGIIFVLSFFILKAGFRNISYKNTSVKDLTKKNKPILIENVEINAIDSHKNIATTVVPPVEIEVVQQVEMSEPEENVQDTNNKMNNIGSEFGTSLFENRNTQAEEAEGQKKREAFLNQKRAEFDAEIEAIPRAEIKLSEEKTKREKAIDMPEIKISNITRSTVIDKMFPLVVLDTETTGIKVGGNDIIEVSAIKYDRGFTPVSCFTTLCKPRKPIPADATAINNITDEMVSESPYFGFVASAFSDYIAGCNIVGHNLPFDLKFLFVSGVQLPPKARYYDTLDLAKRTLKKYSEKYNQRTGEYEEADDYDVFNYKLETLCEYYYIYRSDAHRSLSDCYATALVLQNLIDDKTS